MNVAVAIPTIPPRAVLLQRALASVLAQTLPAVEISIAVDHAHEGGAVTRDRAWRNTTAEWVAFLDDDDEIEPEHLALLAGAALAEDADFVFPWFTVIGGTDPFPHHFGRAWDAADPHQTTITGLWRRSALEKVGGFGQWSTGGTDQEGNRAGEDFMAVCALSAGGGRIVHLAERTWRWHHDSANTSGLPDRW